MTANRSCIPALALASMEAQIKRRLSAAGAKRRNVIVHIAISADGYIARPDGDLEWLTCRSAAKGRHVCLDLNTVERFEDGVVQMHYRVQK